MIIMIILIEMMNAYLISVYISHGAARTRFRNRGSPKIVIIVI